MPPEPPFPGFEQIGLSPETQAVIRAVVSRTTLPVTWNPIHFLACWSMESMRPQLAARLRISSEEAVLCDRAVGSLRQNPAFEAARHEAELRRHLFLPGLVLADLPPKP